MKALSKFYTAFIFVFLYAPIVILVAFSFNSSKSSAWTGFTFKWYEELFKDRTILQALSNTIIVAIVASVVATIIGTMAALGIHSMNKRLSKTVLMINNIPMVNAEIVTGVSLMLLYVFVFAVLSKFGINMSLNMGTLILSHITFNIPYVVLSVLPKLRQMNKHLYEAAMDLGCSPTKAFFKVMLPEIMPGVITGLVMAFTMSIDDFVISYFTSGPNSQTLSIVIYSMTKKGVSPKINAVSALLFGAVLILLLIVNVRDIKYQRKQLKKIKFVN